MIQQLCELFTIFNFHASTSGSNEIVGERKKRYWFFNNYLAMNPQNDLYSNVLKFVLPEELFDYLEIEYTQVEETKIHVYLIEQDIKPEKYSGD